MNTLEINRLFVSADDTLKEAMSRLNDSGSEILLLVDSENKLLRTITDGDIRRLLLRDFSLDDTLRELEKSEPIVVREEASKNEILALMNSYCIHQIPRVDSNGRVIELLLRRHLDSQILLSTPHMGENERTFVNEAFDSNWIAPLGPNVDAFEKEICEKVNVSYAAAVNSGTAAIHLALKVIDIQPNDIVFCSSFTFVASVNPILYEHAVPVFIDSERESWNMCPKALEKALSAYKALNRLPKAVIVVNLYGQCADYDLLKAICAHYGVPIIEDAAESLGSTYKGKSSGTFGDIGIFSFNGNKIITTSGGGMLVSANQEYVERARFLSTQAKENAPHYEHKTVGYNYRMSNILAGVGRGQLGVLDERVAQRRQIFEKYRAALSSLEAIEWQPEPTWGMSNRWLSAFAIGKSSSVNISEFAHRMNLALIETRPLWKPMHQQPLFEGTEMFSVEHKPVCEDLFERGVCLPSGSNMTEEQIDKVVGNVKACFS